MTLQPAGDELMIQKQETQSFTLIKILGKVCNIHAVGTFAYLCVIFMQRLFHRCSLMEKVFIFFYFCVSVKKILKGCRGVYASGQPVWGLWLCLPGYSILTISGWSRNGLSWMKEGVNLYHISIFYFLIGGALRTCRSYPLGGPRLPLGSVREGALECKVTRDAEVP